MFAIPAMDLGGPDRVLFELLRGLDRGRFTPSLLVSEPTGAYLERLPPDVDIIALGPQTSWRDRYPVARALRVVHRVKPAIVMSTLRMNLTLGLARPAFPKTSRLILRQATEFSVDFKRLQQQSAIKHRLARKLLLSALNHADAIICQSEAMRADLASVVSNSVKLTVVGNPIDVAAANATVDSAPKVTPWGSPSLIFVGRLLSSQKGCDVLLQAIARVHDSYPSLGLRIIGDGPDRAVLEQQRNDLGLADVVEFTGFQTNVLPNVAAADLFVLSSHYEGFSNAALESLALGTPVVLTDCPGANRTIVQPGRNGRLAGTVDGESLASAILQALSERASYNRAAIIADTSERYGAAKIVLQYQSVFDKTMQAQRT
jgi:glycosyltransferase involved in cell wall biosynthesis